MDIVGFNARLRPDKPAVSDLTHRRSWTYAEFDRLVAGCCTVLSGIGVEQGDRIACIGKNRAEIIAVHLACARLGAICVPLNWRLSVAELNILIVDCTPKVVFGDEIARSLGIPCSSFEDLYLQAAEAIPVNTGHIDVDSPSMILYTSGTTGKAKGVMITERNVAETAINFTMLGEVDTTSCVLCEAPMFHIIGMITSIRAALMCGAHVVVSDGFVPERTLERFADPALGVTHYFCVPQMAQALRAANNFDVSKLKGLKALFTGGAPHPVSQIQEWLNDGVSAVDGYGSTEAGTVFGMPLDVGVIEKKAGAVGVPTPRVQARLVDGKGQIIVDPDIAGELQLKGDNITKGFWGQPERYTKALTDDGWFKTGDIFSADEDGYYWILDRKKDMFISGGENVYPAEIEALLLKCPGIEEVAVVGVADEKWGEVGCVFYVSEKSISTESLCDFLSKNLARYKLPRFSRKVVKIPRNASGKILKRKLRELVVDSG